MSGEEGDKLKEEGNALFKAGDVLGAFMKYNQAYAKLLAIDNANEGDKASSIDYKRAVLLSNRSNCLFEMSKYCKSSDDAQKCLGLLEGMSKKCEQDSPSIQRYDSLRWKNLLRIARCGVYGGDLHKEDSSSYDKNILQPLHTLEKCGDAAYEKRAKRMLEQVRPLREAILKRGAEGATVPLPSIHRSSLFGTWMSEYYNYGHDIVTSALESGYLKSEDEQTPACPAIELAKLPDEHLSNLSFLFGGVGDARHVYTTLCDVNKQWSELSKAKREKFRLNVILNDINATALSRDVLMMAGMVRLGRLAPTLEACRDTGTEAFRLAAALQYTFFGYTSPEPVHDTVMALIDDLLRDDFSLVKEFMTASDDTWHKIREIMQYWRNAKEGEDYFPTTPEVLDEIFCANSEDKYNPHGLNLNSNTLDQIAMREESERQKTAEMLAHVNGLQLTDPGVRESGMLDLFRSQLPPSQQDDDAKLLDMIKGYMRTEIEGTDIGDVCSGADTPGRFLDKRFIEEVNAILPPEGCADTQYDLIWEKSRTERKCMPLIKKAKKDVRENWKVNRSMFCPKWTKFNKGCPSAGGTLDPNRYNPVAEIGSSFLHAFGLLDYCGSTVDEASTLDFFGCTSLFFWSTSHALANLVAARAVCIELNLGSITTLCRSIQDHDSGRKFHRMLASNIFDYIGMMSLFTEVAPLLHQPTKSVPSYIQTNVLYNTQIWQDYSHYIFAATGIPTLDQANKLLGLRYMNSDSVWIHQNQWTWSKGHPNKGSRKELTEWLHQLLLIALVPPKRNPNQSAESCSMNFATFMRTCVFCVQCLGYPAHWVAGILDEIISACSAGYLKTTAEIPSVRSPTTYRGKAEPHKISMKPFRLEIQSQIGLWMSRYEKILVPLTTLPSRGQCLKYRLDLFQNADETPLEMTGKEGLGIGGMPTKICLGFVLSKKRNPDGTDMADEGESLFANLFPWAPGGDKGKIRSAAIEGDGAIQVFSCMTFDRYATSTERYFIEFWMSEGDFTQYSDHLIYVFRSDTWNQVGLYREDAVMRLREARCVSC